MAHRDYSISVTDNAVDVAYTPSASQPRGKLFGFIFIVSMLILMASALLYLPGKHGIPSMWHDLTKSPSGSSIVVIPIGGLIFIGLFDWQGFRYAQAAWASDETFRGDRQAIKITRSAGSIFPIRLGARTAIRSRK